jgi:hypothetical protein
MLIVIKETGGVIQSCQFKKTTENNTFVGWVSRFIRRFKGG